MVFGIDSISTGMHRIDRSKEAAIVARYISEARGKAVVLFGKRNTGKTDLILRWVAPTLGREDRVYYGACSPDLPAVLMGPQEEIQLDWGALPAGTVFLDEFNNFLSLHEDVKQQGLKKILHAIANGQNNITIVLVLCDENLRDIFQLSSAGLDITNNLFEIPELSLKDVLKSLASSETGDFFSYDPTMLEMLQSDLNKFINKTTSPLLLNIIHEELSRNRIRGSNAIIGPEPYYYDINGLRGLLQEHMCRKLEGFRLEEGVEGHETAHAILEDVVLTGITEDAPNLREIAARIGVRSELAVVCFEWLKKPAGFLRETIRGRVEVQPDQLSEIIKEQIDIKNRELRFKQRELGTAAKSWKERESIIPKEAFECLHCVRKGLKASAEEAAMMVYCSLIYTEGEKYEEVRYWTARISNRSDKITALVRALLEVRPDIRARATRLLGELGDPDVLHKLYRIAIEDGDEKVRWEAVACLGRQNVEGLRDNLEKEAQDPASSYRRNAVSALRIYKDRRAVDILKTLVSDATTETVIRHAAIDSLASIPLSASVEAIVDISLNDDDEEDREYASTALGKIQSSQLQEKVLDRIRDTRLGPEKKHKPFQLLKVLSTLSIWLVAFTLAILNFIIHGIALAALKRFKHAAVFLLLELSLLFVLGLNDGHNVFITNISILFVILNIIACQWLTFKATDNLSPIAHRSLNFRRALRYTVFLTNMPTTFLILHGFGHLMLKRFRRGAIILGLESLSIGCVVAMLIMFPGFRDSYKIEVFNISLISIYFYTGYIIFFGTYFWDVVACGYTLFRSQRRKEMADRRRSAYTKVMANPAAADVVLSRLESTVPGEDRWASRLVHGYGPVIPLNQLIIYLGQHGDMTPAPVIRALKRAKDESSVRIICGLWNEAVTSMKRHILKILAARPSESSIQCLKRLLPGAGLPARLRYILGSFKLRIRLLPLSVWLLILWAFPLGLIFSIEGFRIHNNPGQPLINKIESMRPNLAYAKPVPISNKYDQIEKIREIVQFLAKQYPNKFTAKYLIRFYEQLKDPKANYHYDLKEVLTKGLGTLQMRSTDRKVIIDTRDRIEKNFRSGDAEEVVRTLRVMMQLLKESDQQVFHDFAQSVLSLNVQAMKQVLSSNLPIQMKEETLDAIGFLGTSTAADVLKDFVIQSGQSEKRTTAPNELGESDPKRVAEQEKQYIRLQARALDVLVRINDPKVPGVLKEISENAKSQEVQRKAQRQLKEISTNFNTFAKAAYNNGEYSTAIEQFKNALNLKPNDSELVHWLAMSHDALAGEKRSTGELDEALSEADKAIIADPSFISAYVTKALIYREKGEKSAAQLCLSKASEIDPKYPYLYYLQASIFYQDRQYEKAKEQTLKAIEIEELDNDWSIYLLRDIFLDQNKILDAVNQFEQLNEKYPNNNLLLQQMSYIYHDYASLIDPKYYACASLINKKLRENNDRPDEQDDIDANYIETLLTTGEHRQAAEQADRLAVKTQEPRLKAIMTLIAFAALVAESQYREAGIQLDKLETHIQSLQPDTKIRWSFKGTLNYLQKKIDNGDIKDNLVSLVKTINESQVISKDARDRLVSLVKQNRVALRNKK